MFYCFSRGQGPGRHQLELELQVRAFYLSNPLFERNGVKVDFVYLIATMPGRQSGDQVHKVKKIAALFFVFCLQAILVPESNRRVAFAKAAVSAEEKDGVLTLQVQPALMLLRAAPPV